MPKKSSAISMYFEDMDMVLIVDQIIFGGTLVAHFVRKNEKNEDFEDSDKRHKSLQII